MAALVKTMLNQLTVPEAYYLPLARQLFEEAKVVSLQHLRALETAIAGVRDLSDDIVDAGDLYVPGLHELAIGLAAEDSPRYRALAAGKFPTTARASFAIDQPWADLARSRYALTDYATPKSLED